jgi:hypothetical protein
MELPSDIELLARVDAFLERHCMAPTRLGREATGEPQLIDSIRNGRSPSLKVWNKVADFMARYDAEASAASTGKIDNLPPAGVAA